jgi:type IV pili sensor histidine kinase/response regulator
MTMTRIERHFICTRRLAIICLLGSASASAFGSVASANDWQVGRYQSVRLQPTDQQTDLLSNIVQLELPEDVQTIGQAIAQLLEGSGYRLLSAKLAEPYRTVLFAMPLPEVQRRLGPISLRQALQLLSGPAFKTVIDPSYRLVSFELLTSNSASETDACPTP